MFRIIISETDPEKGSGALLKAACSLPDRVIPVVNNIASVGNKSISTTGELFKKLVDTGCLEPCAGGYRVTTTGAKMAELK